MLILVAGTVSAKGLTVVSASILLFAIAVAIFAKTEPESLLVATAGYAAVMITLIGNGIGTA